MNQWNGRPHTHTGLRRVPPHPIGYLITCRELGDPSECGNVIDHHLELSVSWSEDTRSEQLPRTGYEGWSSGGCSAIGKLYVRDMRRHTCEPDPMEELRE